MGKDKHKDQKPLVAWFKDLTIDDVPLVGGKNASLGEMYRNLSPKGVSIPNGFAVTAHAYTYLLDVITSYSIHYTKLYEMKKCG